MVAAKRFLFDTEFDAVPEDDAEAPPPEPTFSAAALADARAEGMAEGKAVALAEARRSDDRRVAEALEAIGRALGGLAPAQASALEETRRGAIAIAVAIARKIAPEIARRGADEAVAALLADRLPDLLDEPRLVIRLDAARIDAVKERLESVATRSGYGGKLIFLAANGLDAPDCRIEWADGGVERLMARVAGEIDQIVAQYLASPGETPASEFTES
jgi:flagellar assembly protein FliH